ncbi:MAG: asparagine synthase (glutamine-hydrolyzing) [Candidatus Omnitrophica bacterium]|nr:asparagine synthase (glutamine-hydrolyzing) [Candidatus Omnitrophota bacterium]
MCGICGQVSFTDQLGDPEGIRRMTATLTHRGPDDEGYYAAPHVGLGMRRLSVIDLVTGRQPITNEDRSVWVVFNGEIYNHQALRRELEAKGHRFTTHSDTEVIVHLYEEEGPECVRRLNGMFAFAIWDAKAQRLLLARDPLGIKPLYYALQDGRLWFASELKALRADPRLRLTVDPSAVADYFTWLYIPSPYTIFQEAHKLPAGHYLLMSRDGARLERYWRVAFPDGTPPRGSLQDEADQLLDLLRGAVRRQMVADVPVGIFLSGGLDSSGVVALARECASGPLQTFSASFPGMGLYDESASARQVAEQFGCDHHELVISPSAAEALEMVVRSCDEPFGDSSAIPLYYLARFAKTRVTVALSGTGGDDLFAGYRRYQLSRLLPRYQRLPRLLRRGVAEVAARLPAHRRSRLGQWGLYAKRFCGAAQDGATTLEAYLTTLTCCDASLRRALLPAGLEAHPVHHGLLHRPSGDPLELCLAADLATYLPDDLLAKEDRMTMAVGLEGRVPFLDQEVVEFALRLPGDLKLRGATTKYLLRRALRRVLPAGVAERPKHGFAVPVGEWILGELSEVFHDLVCAPTAHSRPWIDPAVAQDALSRHRQGREDLSQVLWALLVFEVWCRQNL